MLPQEAVLVRHDPCPWLPEGGRADVVLAEGSTVPQPTSVVRLLVTAGDSILVFPRPDGRGLDIPTAPVATDVESTLRDLRSRVLTGTSIPRLLGFVRNTVAAAADGYPWPAPVAHFVVWHCEATRDEARQGGWLSGRDAAAHLSERHWWPLVNQVSPDLGTPSAMPADAIEITREHSPESQLEAAGIWARATAKRDNLPTPVEAVAKLPGIQSRLGGAGASLHIARRGGTAEGFALVLPQGPLLELTYLAVDPSAWGKGTGTSLLSHVSDYARSGGFEGLELSVIDDNHRAVHVYKGAGWRATADVKMSGDRLERRMVLRVSRQAACR